eukprot:12200020-Alexandrium_andersonii.AAC.1
MVDVASNLVHGDSACTVELLGEQVRCVDVLDATCAKAGDHVQARAAVSVGLERQLDAELASH